MRFFLYIYYQINMAGCTKERFGGHVKKQRGAGYGREKFEASKKLRGGSHCWMHKKSKKMRKPSKKGKKSKK